MRTYLLGVLGIASSLGGRAAVALVALGGSLLVILLSGHGEKSGVTSEKVDGRFSKGV